MPAAGAGPRHQTSAGKSDRDRRADTFEPWQLFTLAGLIGATLVVFLARGQSPASVILLSLIVFGAAAVGVTALRMVAPLTGVSAVETSQTLGERARAVLEREKALVLRSIKELEFDRAMGKISEKDFAEMSVRLRSRAAGLLQQLDAGGEYQETIAREIERRLAAAPAPAAVEPQQKPASSPAGGLLLCVTCETRNDLDARFCKGCGATLRPTA